MAEKLIDSLTSDFDPAAYRDEYREELLALIERKAEGKELVTAASEEPEPTKAPDLMAALEETHRRGTRLRPRQGGRQAQGPGQEGVRGRQVEEASASAKSSNGSKARSKSSSSRSKTKSRS